MLTKVLSKALTGFEKRLDTRFDVKLDKQKVELMSHMDRTLSDQTRDYRDFTRQEIKASENRLTERLVKRMDDSGSRILLAVAESHDYFVLPRLANVEKRLLKLEAKTA